MEADELILDILATPEQEEIIRCRELVQVLVCGRRWGKTTTAYGKIVVVAFETPGAEIVYVAPTYRRALAAFRALYKVLQPFCVRHRKQPPAEIELFNGSRISFLSFDRPDNLRGDGVDLAVLDEGAKLNGDQVFEVVYPMVADRGGSILIATTFYGTANWAYTEFQKGKTRAPGYVAWLYPTHTGIKFQGEKGKRDLAALRQAVPKLKWDQEFDCIAQANACAFFRFLHRAVLPLLEEQPQYGHSYIIGIDVGRTVDHTACVVLDATTGRVVEVLVFELGIEHSVMAKQCAVLARKWNALPVIDATGGASGGKDDSHIKHYAKEMRDLRAFYWGKNKEDVLNELALDIEQQEVEIPARYVELVSQLERFQCEFVNGKVKLSGPNGQNDDCVSGFAMANHARRKNWKKNSNGLGLENLG